MAFNEGKNFEDEILQEKLVLEKKIKKGEASNYQEARDVVSREANIEEQKIRAKERNKNRPFLDKVFDIDKTNKMDIAMEEAEEMDSEIKKTREANSTTEAVEIINKEGKFGLKGKEKIAKEELANAITLKLQDELNKNNYYKLENMVNDYKVHVRKDLDNETEKSIIDKISSIMFNRVLELAGEGDFQNFMETFEPLIRVKSSKIEPMPKYLVKTNEIQSAVKNRLVEILKKGRLSYFSKMTFYLEKAGIVDAKEAASWPEVKEVAKDELIDDIKNPEENEFNRIIKKYSEEGIITKEEVMSWPEIKKVAKGVLVKTMKYSGVNELNQILKNYLETGIINIKEVRTWPEIKDIAKDIFIFDFKYSGVKEFNQTLKEYSEIGVVDEKEVLAWPEIVELMNEDSK